MPSISALMAELDPRSIARRVGLKHDDARSQYVPRCSRVSTYEEFAGILGDYYNYHSCRCVTRGGGFSRHQAAGRARQVVERDYRRRDQDISAAFRDARDGTNGGLRGILDTIADQLKGEAIEAHIEEILDSHVSPVDPHAQEEIVRQLFAKLEPVLGPLETDMGMSSPQYYAARYRQLIRKITDAARKIGDSV